MHAYQSGDKREKERERKTNSYLQSQEEGKQRGRGERKAFALSSDHPRETSTFFFFDKHIYQERGLAHRFTLCPKNDLYFECYGSGLVAKSCPTLATPWTEKPDRLQFMGFSRQEYWSELPFPSPGDLPNPGIEPRFPAF